MGRAEDGGGRGRVGLPLAAAGGAAGAGAAVAAGVVRALEAGGGPRTVVLVEGSSDLAAIEALARRGGHDLAAAGVAVVPMGGATNARRFAEVLGPGGHDVRLAALCDVGEAAGVRRGLARGGVAAPVLFVCDRDLEDELIRAAGVAFVEQVIEARGEARALRTLRVQAAQSGRPAQDVLHRFMGSKGGRKVAYARALVERLDEAALPAALVDALAFALADGPPSPVRRRSPPGRG